MGSEMCIRDSRKADRLPVRGGTDHQWCRAAAAVQRAHRGKPDGMDA